MPLICIIIPSYNHADYLGQAVQSAIDQTFADIEIIVVDDGSTDHTQEVLANTHDPRLHIVWQPNGGLLAARNRGIGESSAPFVTFLDADDLFVQEKLTVLFSHLQDNPETGLVAGGVKYVDHTGQVLKIAKKGPDSLDAANLLLGNPIHVSAILLRREWLEHVGGFGNGRLFDACGDWDLWLRLAFAGCKIDLIEHVVAGYRITPDQMSQNPLGMRSSHLAVLSKFFNQPDLPPVLKGMQNQAKAVALVNAAARAFYSADFTAGNKDLAEAISLDPDLAVNHYQLLVKLLVGWAHAPYSLAAESYLNGILQHLPSDLSRMRLELRKAKAAVALQPLFGASGRARRKDRWTLLEVVKNDPSWLRNRGVLRMLYDAWTS